MKTISMDYITYRHELADEFKKGQEASIVWLFDQALSKDSDLLTDFILRKLEEDENFSLADRLRAKRLNYLVGGK